MLDFVKYAWATPAAKCQADPEINFGIPPDADKIPLRKLDWNVFKDVSYVCLGSHVPTTARFISLMALSTVA